MNDTTNEEPSSHPSMISVGDPKMLEIPPAVLESPGGFSWRYVDAIDEEGNGLVVIWSFGLPFLPGYLSGARKGLKEPARTRPSLNIALYKKGKRAFYLLQTYEPEQVTVEGGSFQFGQSAIRCEANRSTLDLNCALPRSKARLQGKITVEGSPAIWREGSPLALDLEHRWTPVLGPALVQSDLHIQHKSYRFEGVGYHDRNDGTRRFDDLGIDHWIWGRLCTPQKTTVWYLCFAKQGPPSAWGVEMMETGEVRLFEDLSPELEGLQRGLFGLRTWQWVRLRRPDGSLFAEAKTGARVDDGFFYARTLVQARTESPDRTASQSGTGLAEWIVPDRIDLAQHRPLVRMAIHSDRGPNSFWLPLFAGPSQGRVSRLLFGRS